MIRFGFGRKKKEYAETQAVEAVRRHLNQRALVMVGLMGCGKSAVGRRLAGRLSLPFIDADEEIEKAAGKSINDIFSEHGEAHFREGERKVIARLLGQGAQVLATGGGAFINAETRANIRNNGISIWLKADLPVLMKRVAKRDTRPLLKSGDPEATMRKLIEVRYPVYAEADITIESRDVAHEVIVSDVLQALRKRLEVAPAALF
ncbi:MAG: shikimate kinase [Hyphomicrobium sp.]